MCSGLSYDGYWVGRQCNGVFNERFIITDYFKSPDMPVAPYVRIYGNTGCPLGKYCVAWDIGLRPSADWPMPALANLHRRE